MNDTVGTLAAARYIDGQDTIAAMIMGTGVCVCTLLADAMLILVGCNSEGGNRQCCITHALQSSECIDVLCVRKTAPVSVSSTTFSALV